MRILKKTLPVLLALCVATVLLVGCGSEPQSEAATEDDIVTVQRGDLIIDVVSSGNLALSDKEDLAFEVAGTVEDILVEEGDVVEEGQVLATLDISEWQDDLEGLEDAVTAAERSQLQVQINLHTAEQNLKNSRDNQAARELALLNAQINLDQAEYNLSVADETYTWPELEDAEADVEEAEAHLEYALYRLEEAETTGERTIWTAMVRRYQATLAAAETRLEAMLSDADTEEVAIHKLRVESAELALAQAQEDLAEVAQDIALKELQLALAQANLVAAQKALEDAQEALAEAESESPLITAPFNGFITEVNVEGGDEVLKGTVAVQLADPAKFEADILVNEMDILQVKLGGQATIEVDAMSGVSFPAKVTHISPTATIQSGVVSYQVKVELQSLTPQESTVSGSQLLREGLTVTVSIIIEERKNVLLVPNKIIIAQGQESFVQVIKDGVIEQRPVQTGLSDWQNTEIIEGLSEGEQVVAPRKTTTPDTEESRPRGMFGGG